MKKAIVIMALVTVGIWSYNVGAISPILQNDHITLSKDYQEVECNDIVRGTDGVLVCEINLNYEDDNIRVFRGAYGK